MQLGGQATATPRRLVQTLYTPLTLVLILAGLTLTWTGHSYGYPLLSVGIILGWGPETMPLVRRQVLWARKHLLVRR